MNMKQMITAGCYRLASGVSLRQTKSDGMVAVCNYPLHVVPLNPVLARLLLLCTEEHTCEQLAVLMHMPLKHIEVLCDQLRWKSLLEAGPVEPLTVWPEVSIVIPSYNRAKELERCLHALFVLKYPHDLLEIIVVDDASTDTTRVMLQGLKQEAEAYGVQLRSVSHEKRQGVAISRNTGAEASTHDFIAYIDSDCVASPTWLTELVPLFQDQRIVAVGGMIRGYECQSVLGRYEDVCSSLYMGRHSQQVRMAGPLTYLPTANLLIRRSIWQRLGGFAPLTQGEDVDFCRRILLTGAYIHYVPLGVVYHEYRATIKSFLKIRVAYASAEAALLQRHPTERRVLILPPAQAAFAGLIVSSVWGLLCALWFGRGKKNAFTSFSTFIAALLIVLHRTLYSMRKLHKQYVPIHPITVFKATLRGYFAYSYHLFRHLTRYYTLPLVFLMVTLFPLCIPIAVILCIVVGVDYVRFRPKMGIVEYALCAFLSDCAYEVGVVQGCIKHRTWQPLVPIIKKHVR
jgi:mycofactocin system glycosyltransferase